MKEQKIKPGDRVEHLGLPDLDYRTVLRVGRTWLTLDFLGTESELLPLHNYRRVPTREDQILEDIRIHVCGGSAYASYSGARGDQGDDDYLHSVEKVSVIRAWANDPKRGRLSTDTIKRFFATQWGLFDSIGAPRELCPRCGKPTLCVDPALNALSRKDNKTYVCSSCGTAEAIIALADGGNENVWNGYPGIFQPLGSLL